MVSGWSGGLGAKKRLASVCSVGGQWVVRRARWSVGGVSGWSVGGQEVARGQDDEKVQNLCV